MTQTLKDNIANFITARIGCSQLWLEDNSDYQEALNEINTIDSQSVLNAVDKAIEIAEISAYKLGLHDGLNIMADCEV